jgi:hypothetical protein
MNNGGWQTFDRSEAGIAGVCSRVEMASPRKMSECRHLRFYLKLVLSRKSIRSTDWSLDRSRLQSLRDLQVLSEPMENPPLQASSNTLDVGAPTFSISLTETSYVAPLSGHAADLPAGCGRYGVSSEFSVAVAQ